MVTGPDSGFRSSGVFFDIGTNLVLGNEVANDV